MKYVVWTATVLGAFVLGWWLGARQLQFPPADTPSASSAAGADSAPAGSVRPDDPGRPDPAAASGDAGTQAGWEASLDRLDQLTRSGGAAAATALRERLLGALREQARRGDVDGARARLAAYLERNLHDPLAYLLDADLLQMQGRTRAAFDPLLDLLAFADDPEVVRRARDELGRLVEAREAQLINTADTGGVIRMYEDLARYDPAFDGHRLRLARWQLNAGQLDAAARTLAETGTAGVDPRAREELAAEVRLARARLPVEHRAGAMHVSATMAGRAVTMLVDTGASTTAISRQVAEGLGAVPTGVRVQVSTANGVVESEVHRVTGVEVGPLRLDSLSVLVLEGPLPRGVDGLLGMDVLSRFPERPW